MFLPCHFNTQTMQFISVPNQNTSQQKLIPHINVNKPISTIIWKPHLVTIILLFNFELHILSSSTKINRPQKHLQKLPCGYHPKKSKNIHHKVNMNSKKKKLKKDKKIAPWALLGRSKETSPPSKTYLALYTSSSIYQTVNDSNRQTHKASTTAIKKDIKLNQVRRTLSASFASTSPRRCAACTDACRPRRPASSAAARLQTACSSAQDLDRWAAAASCSSLPSSTSRAASSSRPAPAAIAENGGIGQKRLKLFWVEKYNGWRGGEEALRPFLRLSCVVFLWVLTTWHLASGVF